MWFSSDFLDGRYQDQSSNIGFDLNTIAEPSPSGASPDNNQIKREMSAFAITRLESLPFFLPEKADSSKKVDQDLEVFSRVA